MIIKYISKEGLENLNDYGYHGTDESFLGNNYLCHWWNYIIEFMPMNLA